eukprot:5895353-Ditylum_brightwellii.AAC.1
MPPHVYQLSFKLLQKEQQKDKTFLEALKKSKMKDDIKIFQGADKSRSQIFQEGLNNNTPSMSGSQKTNKCSTMGNDVHRPNRSIQHSTRNRQ